MPYEGAPNFLYTEKNGKHLFAGFGKFDNFDFPKGSRGKFNFSLTVEKKPEFIMGMCRSDFGYYTSMPPLFPTVKEDLERPTVPIEYLKEMEMARKNNTETKNKDIFGEEVEWRNVRVATFDKPYLDYHALTYDVLKSLPTMIQLEMVNALHNVYLTTFGDIDPNILEIGYLAQRSDDFRHRIRKERGEWYIGASVESFSTKDSQYIINSNLKKKEIAL